MPQSQINYGDNKGAVTAEKYVFQGHLKASLRLYGRREGLRQIITRSYTNFVDRTIFGV